MNKVGILYDNISGNTGDEAIGLSLKKILRQLDVPFDELVPGRFNPLEYETIIVGGGHILRPGPDFYYDKFRVCGNHILNAAGIMGDPKDLDYLNDYRYITVRSNGDREKLAYLDKEVHVIPCTSMLLEDLPDFSFALKKPCIGMHILPLFTSSQDEDTFIMWASALPFTIYFLPITHYNRDIDTMRKLQARIPNAELLPIFNAREIFTIIGRFDYFISCSLHGAIFAYVHNVPFAAYDYNDKMRFFMEDRGLGRFLFKNTRDMKHAFGTLQEETPDYTGLVRRDREILDRYIAHIKTILPPGNGNPGKKEDNIEKSDHRIQFLLQGMSGLTRKNSELVRHINTLENTLADRDCRIRLLKQENEALTRSIVHKVTMKLHRTVIERVFSLDTRRRRYYDLGLEAGRILVDEGPDSLWEAFRKKTNPRANTGNTRREYARWIRINESKIYDNDTIKADIASFASSPRISICVPIWDVDKKWLERMIESVSNQVYQNWELCIVDAGSRQPHIRQILTSCQEKDPRIKVRFLNENRGISENTNEALEIAEGDYIGFLDHDDELAPFALYEVVKYINSHPAVRMIYSDEDKLDMNNIRSNPFFKPDWAPDHILSQNYICHFLVIERAALAMTGKFRKVFDGSQDYDLILRVTENIGAGEIGHIHKVLYHWRMLPSSTSYSIETKPSALVNSKKAIEEALIRRKIQASIEDGIIRDTYRVRYAISGKPLVSIIIPTRDHAGILKTCIDSIFLKTTYDNYEIIIVDNNSTDAETANLFADLKNNSRIRIVEYPGVFNFSRINNFAVGHARGGFILFLNNDTEIISGEWLSAMLEHAQRREVGAVGAKLIYRDNTVQHAGVVLGIGSRESAVAGHSHKYTRADAPGYFSSLNIIRNYSAVTAACMMMKKEVFEEAGGFDETLGVAFNDVELCLRIRDMGYLIVYTPYAELYHDESRSRGYEDSPEKRRRIQAEIRYIRSRWGREIDKGDPYYNSNLSRLHEDYSLNLQE